MDSGLGNQMLDYAEYLAIKKSNSDGLLFLETIIYDIPEHDGMISQWNGYELSRIFGIKVPMLKDFVGSDSWKRIINKVEQSEFWNNNWNYAPIITDAINDEGYNIVDLQKNSRKSIMQEQKWKKNYFRANLTKFFQTYYGYQIKRVIKKIFQEKLIAKENSKYDIYQKYPDNVFIGHSFAFKYKGFGIEQVDEEIREAFVFPPVEDEQNMEALRSIRECNAVAIHARRGDMLFLNGYCYKYGFFRRAVKYIKKHVNNPVFYFFCDEDSHGWCEENSKIFGLNFDKDIIRFVTWNSGTESFRDMQLMAECKHNIFTESSFGFWGAYLNKNPNKITCAPDPTILATNWF